MTPRHIASAGLAAAVLAVASPAAAQVDNRQDRQQQRIERGVAQGDLNARETGRLARQQGRIAGYEARSRADGPGYTPRERARTDRMQDRASRNIFRQRNDRQRRPN